MNNQLKIAASHVLFLGAILFYPCVVFAAGEAPLMEWDSGDVSVSNKISNENGNTDKENAPSKYAGEINPAVDPSSGIAIQTISLQLPPGRGDAVPDFAIRYSSGNKDGWLGVGYDLVIGSIRRATKHGLSYTGDSFEVVTPKGTVELLPRSEWGANYYGAKIEHEFTKYCFVGDYFVATTREGVKYFYGSTANSREDYPQGVFQWHLDRIEDTNGNYLTVSYYRPAATSVGGITTPRYYTYYPLYPSVIEYSGNTKTSTLPYYSIEFGLESRGYAVLSMSPDQRTLLEYRLASINSFQDVHGAKTQVGQYTLTYDNAGANGASRITTIGHSGISYKTDSLGRILSETETLPSMTLGWSNGWDGSLTTRDMVQIPRTEYQPMVADIDGDGKDEVVLQNAIYHYNKETGVFEIAPASMPPTWAWETPSTKVTTADVNGDGKQDIILTYGENGYGSSDLRVFLSNGDNSFGTNNQPNFQIVLPIGTMNWVGAIDGVNDLKYNFADINGDGRADIYLTYSVQRDGQATKYYVQSIFANVDGSYSGFETFPGFHNVLYNPATAYNIRQLSQYIRLVGVGDINGDARADLLFTTKDDLGNSATNTIDAWLSRGDGAFTSVVSELPSSPTPVFLHEGSSLGDFNGDGYADLYVNLSAAVRIIYYSNADGSFDFGHPVGLTRPQVCDQIPPNIPTIVCAERLRDLDGDGRTDVVMYQYQRESNIALQSSSVFVYTALPNGTIATPLSPAYTLSRNPPFYLLNRMSLLVGDFSGDVGSDLLFQGRTLDPIDFLLIIETSKANQDLLSSFRNGYGATTDIDYLPSSSFQNTNLNFVFPVVSRLAVNDGLGTTAITDYVYSGV